MLSEFLTSFSYLNKFWIHLNLFFSLSKISHKAESSLSSPKPCHCFVRKNLRKINSKHKRRIESYFHLLPSRAFLIIPVTFGEYTDWPQCVTDLEGSTIQNHDGQAFPDKGHSRIHRYSTNTE